MKTMKTMKRLILLLITTVFIYSCAPSISFVDTSCPSYKDRGFQREMINDYGVALMPILGGEGKEAYRRPMGDAMITELDKSFEIVKSPSEVINSLNKNEMTDEYYDAIENYNTTAIVPMKLIGQMGKVLDVRYLLYTKLLADSEVELLYTGYYSYNKIEVVELFVETQIWDTELGDIVWEGKGGFAQFSNNVQFNTVNRTAEGLVNVLGNDIGEGACENPKELFNAAEKAHSGTLWSIVGVSTILLIIIAAI